MTFLMLRTLPCIFCESTKMQKTLPKTNKQQTAQENHPEGPVED